MTALSIQPTYPIFTDIDGQPLEAGYIWIGTENLPPITNPITVYWDAALTLPAAQPIRTIGGYPMNSGTPARLYVNSNYSIQVQNKNGSLIYSAPAATERYGNVISSTDVSFIQAGTGAVTRTAQAKMRDVVSPEDFGAVGDGTADDTTAVQTALNTGKNVLGNGIYKITDSLYMNTDDQSFKFRGITMSAALGKAAILLGSQNSSGTPVVGATLRIAIEGKITGTGTKTPGSTGIGMVQCTTSDISVRSWGFYAGIDVRALSIVNYFRNCDLRYNVYGLYDPSTNSAVSDIQGSEFTGGRIEANQKAGVYTGSPNIKFIGTCIEGNGGVINGGTGTDPEVEIIAHNTGNSIHFIDCYMETYSANTGDAMIQVNANASKFVNIIGGEYYAQGSALRYIVKSLSNSTTQSFNIVGGFFGDFKNYVSATIKDNSSVSVIGVYANQVRDVTTDVTIGTGGPICYQSERGTGTKSNLGARFKTLTTSEAAASDAITIVDQSFINLGGNRRIYSDGTNIIIGNTGINVTMGGGTGNVGVGQLELQNSGCRIYSGNGNPAFVATRGSLFLRRDGGAGSTLYVNETGTGTWRAV